MFAADPDAQISAARRKYLSEAGYRVYEQEVRKGGVEDYVIDGDGIKNLEDVCDGAPDFECGAELRAAARRHAVRIITARRLQARQRRLSGILTIRDVPFADALTERKAGIETEAHDQKIARGRETALEAQYRGFKRFSDTLNDHF